jgi:hypothetical protein
MFLYVTREVVSKNSTAACAPMLMDMQTGKQASKQAREKV